MSIVPYAGSNFNLSYSDIYRGARYTRNMLRGTRARNPGQSSGVLATKTDVLRLYRTVQSRAPEMKFRDFPLTNGSQPTGSVISVDLCNIPQGVTRNDRIGSKVLIKGIQVRGRNCSAPQNFSMPTMFILRSFTNTQPLIGDFNTQYGVFVEPREFKEHLQYQPQAQMGGSIKKNVYFGKRGMQIQYTGTGGTSSVRNRMYLANVNPLGGNAQNVSLSARVWYTDA